MLCAQKSVDTRTGICFNAGMNRYDLCCCGAKKRDNARLCKPCYLKSRPLEIRFWAKVNKNGPFSKERPELGRCWTWIGAIGSHGYGQIYDAKSKRMITAPRVSLTLSGVALPLGSEPDHLCKNKPCVNPLHLEVVEKAVNLLRGDSPPAINARKTHCTNGHPFNEENTYKHNGHRECRACWKLDRILYRAQRLQYMKDRRLRLKEANK
jgi:hypothetical protein